MWDRRMQISNEFSSDVAATGWEATLGESLFLFQESTNTGGCSVRHFQGKGGCTLNAHSPLGSE